MSRRSHPRSVSFSDLSNRSVANSLLMPSLIKAPVSGSMVFPKHSAMEVSWEVTRYARIHNSSNGYVNTSGTLDSSSCLSFWEVKR